MACERHVWYVVGTGDMFDHPEPFPLRDSLVESVNVVAELLGGFRSEVLTSP